MPWYYYDTNGERKGPIRSTELKALAEQGTVTPTTLVEDETSGRIATAKELRGLTFSAPPPSAPNPFVAVPPVTDKPSASSVNTSRTVAKGKELAQQGVEQFTKGVGGVMTGLSAAKDAAMARLKLHGLQSQLTAAYRLLGDAAEQAGWGGELCESIRKQKAEVAVATAQHGKAASDAELAKNTPGAGAAKQVLSTAKAQMTLVGGVLDGLREKMGRTLMEDASAPPSIGAEQRREISRLMEEIADCERIVAHGKTSLLSKPVLIAAAVLVVVGLAVFAMLRVPSLPSVPGFQVAHPLKNAKPGDWAKYELTERATTGSGRETTKRGTQLVEVLSNDGKKVKVRTTTKKPDRLDDEDETIEESEIDLSQPPESWETFADTRDGFDGADVKFETGEETKTTLRVAGRELNCIVTPFTMTGRVEGYTFTTVGKSWTTHAFPVMVKHEMTMDTISVAVFHTMTLTDFGSAK